MRITENDRPAQNSPADVNFRVSRTTWLSSDLAPKEATLEEVLEGKDLSKEEKRAMQAADALKIFLADKKTLMAAYLFFGTGGVFRAKEVLGININQTVAARDKVSTSERYEGLWQSLEILLRPNFVEVALDKKSSLSHGLIAAKLNISIGEVNEISKILILADLIEPSPRVKSRVRKARETYQEIIKLRARSSPRISNPEIASRLGVSLATVEKVVGRASSIGNVVKGMGQQRRSREQIEARREKVRLLWNTTNLQQAEIAEELAVGWGEVRYDLIVLRKQRKVLAQKPGVRRRTVQAVISEANPT